MRRARRRAQMGGAHTDRARRQGRGAAVDPDRRVSRQLSDGYGELFREHWRAAVATTTRLTGDLEVAEDAVQEACALALAKWPADGVPANPRAWLCGTARHKALDRMRRESLRAGKEAAAMREPVVDAAGSDADELGLIFMCCHPALDPAARIALTLRSLCGLDTRSIAAAFLLPEATVAQRIVRAKRKIRDAGIRLRVPDSEELPARLAAVLRVVYLVY